jgi:serine/threonine-protein kinase HipA
MHLKNMALLKIAEPGDRQFRTVRLAPLYDAVTTRVFPKLKHDRLALKLNGKDDNLRRADFQALATTAGLRAGDAEGAVDEVVQRLRGALDVIAVPDAIPLSDETRQMTVDMFGLCRRRIEGMA